MASFLAGWPDTTCFHDRLKTWMVTHQHHVIKVEVSVIVHGLLTLVVHLDRGAGMQGSREAVGLADFDVWGSHLTDY